MRKYPFPDAAGNALHEGDRIRHPGGTEAVVVYDTAKSNRWRAVYDDGASLWLDRQIGSKGLAVRVEAAAVTP